MGKIYYEVSKLIDKDDKIHSISIKIYDFYTILNHYSLNKK